MTNEESSSNNLPNGDLMQVIQKDEKFWKSLCSTYGVLASSNARKIILEIIKKDGISTNELIKNTKLPENIFYPKAKQLRNQMVIRRTLDDTNESTVNYHLTSFAKFVLGLSEDLLKRVEVEVQYKDSVK